MGSSTAWWIIAVALLALARPMAAVAADVIGAKPAPAASPAGPPVVSESEAAQHVGEEVTVEGRVHATHVSQLATVLAFAPNFSGFTATIHAGDRDRFPADLAERARNRVARVRGVVASYRGRPEMTLKDPRQLTFVDAEPPPPVVAPRPTPASLPEQVTAALERIEDRLDAIENRIDDLENAEPVVAVPLPPPLIAVGMPASDLRTRFGDPLKVEEGLRGRRVFVYSGGRTVDVDAAGRVMGWNGF
jgi:hypothetical protein